MPLDLIPLIVVAGCLGSLGVVHAEESAILLKCPPYVIELGARGGLARIEKRGTASVASGLADKAGEIQYGSNSVSLEKPAAMKRGKDDACCFIYRLLTQPPIAIEVAIHLRPGKGTSVVLDRQATIQSTEPLREDLTIKLPLWPRLNGDT